MSRTFFTPDGKFIIESNGETVAAFARDAVEFTGRVKVDEIKLGGNDGPLLQKEAGTGAFVNGGVAIGGGSSGISGIVINTNQTDVTAEAGKLHVNLNAGAQVTYTLPYDPADGTMCAFICKRSVSDTFVMKGSGASYQAVWIEGGYNNGADIDSNASLDRFLSLMYCASEGTWFPISFNGTIYGA